jgi:hypothetical protein
LLSYLIGKKGREGQMYAVKQQAVWLALLLLLAACTPPAHAAAQRAARLQANHKQVLSSPLSFTSTLEVTEFIAENNQLIALGLFAVTDFEGNTDTVPVTLPVNDMVANPECSVLTVTLGPLDMQVLGMSVNAQTVEFVTVANPEKGFSEVMLCGIVEAFKGADMKLVAALLNEALALFGWS